MNRVGYFLLAALLGATGCSNESGPVTMRAWGDVSFEGKPIQDGTITFEGTDGAPPAQGPIKDGKYDLPAATGPVADREYVVRINSLTKSGETLKNIMDESTPTMDVMVDRIPEMFNVASTIKKMISSEASKNEFSFKLLRSGAYE